MSASLNDKITDVRNAARPNTATVTISRGIAGTELNCNALTGWPTDSKVHFVTYQIDTNSNPIVGTQLDCYGIVSGADITSVTVVDGTDGGNSVGDIVEMLPTAAWAQDLADALTEEHDRTGLHTDAMIARLGAVFYPVGSIYTNATVSTNPATLLGFGSWSAFGSGRVLVSSGTSDQAFTAGATGGESTHVLTTAEMPSHTHSYPILIQSADTDRGTLSSSWSIDNVVTANTASAGSDAAHNNLQPYIVVYMWRRTA